MLFGKRARALAEVGEDLHDVLGDHRDEVLFAEHVRRAAAHAAHEGGAGRRTVERWPSTADDRAAERLCASSTRRCVELRRAEREVGGIPLSAA